MTQAKVRFDVRCASMFGMVVRACLQGSRGDTERVMFRELKCERRRERPGLQETPRGPIGFTFPGPANGAFASVRMVFVKDLSLLWAPAVLEVLKSARRVVLDCLDDWGHLGAL